MDEKVASNQPPHHPHRGSWRRATLHFIRTTTTTLLVVGALIYFLPDRSFARSRPWSTPGAPSAIPTTEANNTSLIPLEVHIMSKCGDARDCLIDLVVPAMEKVADDVNFTLSYIGTMGADDTVQCKHGPNECLGNMLSLCAASLYPHDVKRSLGFSMCMIDRYREIPQRGLVEHCALEHGIAFERLNGCVSDEGLGTTLLERSIKRSQEAGVKESCTVRLQGEVWCVRNAGEWKGCEKGHEPQNLVEAITNLTTSMGQDR